MVYLMKKMFSEHGPSFVATKEQNNQYLQFVAG